MPEIGNSELMNKGANTENIYNEIVRYARELLGRNDGVKLDELRNHLLDKGYKNIGAEGSNENRAMISCLKEYFHSYGMPEHESKHRYYLTPQAYFSSISHDNYMHSLENAKSSKRLSMFAISISSILAVGAIFIGCFQIRSAKVLSETQSEEVKFIQGQIQEIIEKQSLVISNLDSIDSQLYSIRQLDQLENLRK